MVQLECAKFSAYKTKLLSGVMLAPLVTACAVTALSFSQPLMAAQAAASVEVDDEFDEFEEIIIEGKKYYRHKEASSGTKMNMQVKDTPQSIKVITSDVIDVASIRSFEDIYKVDASGDTSHARDSFPRNFYRGFEQQGDNAIKIDGFRMSSDIDLDLATFERFEVIKGPTSTLYGQTPIGGTLNAVSKKPQDEFGLAISGEIGSYDLYRGDLDITGPLTEDGRWSYRFITAYEDEGSFIDFAETDALIIAPSLQFNPSDNTSILATINYQKHNDVFDFGSPLIRTTDDDEDPNFNALQLADVPRSRFYGMPFNNADKEALFATVSAEHVFENDWTIRSIMQYNKVTSNTLTFLALQNDSEGVGELEVVYGLEDEDEIYSGEINLFGEVEAFGQDHTLFFGVDASSAKAKSKFDVGLRFAGFSIFDPDYTLVDEPTTPEEIIGSIYGYGYTTDDKTNQYGATVQGLFRPTDDLTVSAGGRYSITDEFSQGFGDNAPTNIDETVKAFTFQFSATYALTEDLNAYFMYGETFEPNFGRIADGSLADPEKGRSYEAGLKGEFGEMSYSLAVFDTKRTNISQDIPFSQFVLLIGEQQSKGIELDFSGELLPNLNVIGSVAYLDAEFTEGDFKGLRPTNAPKFGLSLFTGYQFEGALEGFSVGAGIVYKSGRRAFAAELPLGDSFFSFDFGSYTELDASISYEQDNWSIDLSATNFANSQYYSAANNRFEAGVSVNPPRQFSLSFSYEY